MTTSEEDNVVIFHTHVCQGLRSLQRTGARLDHLGVILGLELVTQRASIYRDVATSHRTDRYVASTIFEDVVWSADFFAPCACVMITHLCRRRAHNQCLDGF